MTSTTSRRRAGALLGLGLAATALPAVSLQAVPWAGAAAATEAPATLAPTALALAGGANGQVLGATLNSTECHLDADRLADVTAGSALALGSSSFADMPAYRRAVSQTTGSFASLPHWSSFSVTGTAGWTCAGDVNADGFDDLLQVPAASASVLAVHHSSGRRNAAGKLVENRVRTYQFPRGAARLAQSAAGAAGDVDGDGHGDVLVSEHTASTQGRVGNGRLWVLAGAAAQTVPDQVSVRQLTTTGNSSTDVALVIDGAAAGDALGTAVSLGDVTGDGLDDLAVASATSGSVWLINGRRSDGAPREIDLAHLSPQDGRLLATQSGTGGSTRIGASLAAGDVNGDGVTDVVTGAARTLSAEGAAVVLHGGVPGTATVDLSAGTVQSGGVASGYVVRAEGSTDALGYSVAVLGDQDGDGRDELLVGAPGYDVLVPGAGERLVDAGAAYLLRGRAETAAQDLVGFASAATTAAGHRVEGGRGAEQSPAVASRFGQKVAATGDVDGNGTDDFAVSAPGRTDHATATQGTVTVGLRGELATALTLNVARRDGDDGVPVTAADAVLSASDLVDLRAGLRLSTSQGLEGQVAFTLDGLPLDGCAAEQSTISAPHRAWAFCSGQQVATVGEHTLGAAYAGIAGRHGAAKAVDLPVLVTDATRTHATAVADGVEAHVVTATAGNVVENGAVTFTAPDGTVLAAEVPLRAGVARLALAPGAQSVGIQASYSGFTTSFGGESVALLAASSAQVEKAQEPELAASLALSAASLRKGDSGTATLVLNRAVTGRVELLVAGRLVRSADLTGTHTVLALPQDLAVGRHRVDLRTTGTGEVETVSASGTVTITRAASGVVRASAQKFVPRARPKVVVRVARSSDGTWPAGKVTVKVSGTTTTATLKASSRGTVTVRLPRRTKKATATVRFVPTKSGSYTTPKRTTVRLLPRS